MNYQMIYNNPLERMSFTYPWCFWDNAFTNEELDEMCRYLANNGVERGTTVSRPVQDENGNVVVNQAPNEEVRKSNVKFHFPNQDTNWIFERLNGVIGHLNAQYYNFDLNGYDSFQYTEYEAHENGKYDFHQDMIMGNNIPPNMVEPRKLSLVMMLAEPGVDFEGGEFEINVSEEKKAEPVEFKRGRIVVFPSFILHRVKPVTKGKRKSLVVWVTGPKFR